MVEGEGRAYVHKITSNDNISYRIRANDNNILF